MSIGTNKQTLAQLLIGHSAIENSRPWCRHGLTMCDFAASFSRSLGHGGWTIAQTKPASS